MKRRITTTIAGLALLALLSFAAPAMAAPNLAVQLDRYPETIFANDVFLGYKVDVKNTGPDPTSGQLNVSIQLPAGLSVKRAEGAGWKCSIPFAVCTSSQVVAPGGSYPTLDLRDVRIGDGAPEMPVARVVAFGGGAPGFVSAEDSFLFDPAVPFGLIISEARAIDDEDNDVTQAGGHPYEAYGVFETTKLRGQVGGSGEVPLAVEDIHAGVAELPVGVVGNPEVAEAACTFAELRRDDCPKAAAVGGVAIFASANGNDPPDVNAPKTEPVYRMVQEKGFAASFGFKSVNGLGPAFIVRAKVRSDGDYGITTLIPLVPQEPKFFGANFAFCGFGAEIVDGALGPVFKSCMKSGDPEATEAFITLGTDCSIGEPLTRFAIDSWTKRGRYADNGLPDLSDPNWRTLDFRSPELEGCELLTAEWVNEKRPSFAMRPDSQAADSPAAYTAKLEIPQQGLTDPGGLGNAHLKDTVVTLPQGLTFNPSIAHRLEACSLQQMGYLGNNFPYPNRIRFDTKLPNCPEASKIGNAEVVTPLIADPLRGSIYLAAQTDNPFGSNYAIYLVVEEEDLGVVAKLPGKVDLDPNTGRISATFKDNPQLPFEDLELKFFGGDRAALANPVTCGQFETKGQFTPWSAVDPDNPQPQEIANTSDTIEINAGANGAPCVSDPAQRPFDIGLNAGATNPVAGVTSPFSIQITRPDGSQELDRLDISPPPGFVASLRGIPYCSEAQIAAARSAVSGRAEQANPSCSPASEVGSVTAGAGPGATPFYVPGKLYLAGPYKGAPLSVVAITPAVAGPYDLGNVVIRSALTVDPRTARITAVTDAIPQIHEGVPLRIRDIRINLDRPNWVQNPTNCEAMSVDLTAFGSNGAVSRPSTRFQVGNCAALGFKPNLKIQLHGGTRRAAYQRLEATVTARAGDANIARAAVTLPHSAFLAQEHIRTVCTRVQFAARTCPPGSVYGSAEAVTPLLDDKLTGPVYLRSSNNQLPDLVAALRGPDDQPIEVELAGRTDSKNGGIRNTFDLVPDAPVSKFTLKLFGGKKSLIINSRDLCKGPKQKANVRLDAQNGRVRNFRPVVGNDCGKKKGKQQKKRR